MRIPHALLCLALLVPPCAAVRAEEPPAGPGVADALAVARAILEGDADQAREAAGRLAQASAEQIRRVQEALRTLARGGRPLAEQPGGPIEPGTEDPPPALRMTVHVVEVEADGLDPLLGAWRPGRGRPAVYLPAAEAEALLERLEANSAARVVSAPSVVTLDGRRAEVSMLEQIAFVEDYDVQRSAAGEVTLDPVVGVLQEGHVLGLMARLDEDGRHARLEVDLAVAQVGMPIPEQERTIEGATVRVQCPEVSVQRTRGGIHLPVGGHAIFGSGEQGRGTAGAFERFVVVRVERVELPLPPRANGR